MDLHGNAALSWSGRRELVRRVVDQGWTLRAAAEAAGVSVRCTRKWVGRYRAGDVRLLDHSSAPRRVANRTAPERVAVIVKLRRLRMTAAEIAETLAMPVSTVSGILTRLGLGRLGRLGLEQCVRYERSRPGELVHIDVKKLGRIERGAGKRWRDGKQQHYTGSYTDAAGRVRRKAGWEFVHIAVDTTPASPMPKSSPTSARQRPSPSSAARSSTTAATASRSSACSPTTAAPTSARSTRSPAAASASVTSAPGRADLRPTAKQSGSSAPSSTAGPTAPSTAQAANATPPLTAGSGTTDESQVAGLLVAPLRECIGRG